MVASCICRTTPPISHLLYADDSFIFGKVTTAEAQRLKDILIHYECSSDQAINDGKFAISFCANTLHDTIVVISNSLVVCGQLVVVNIWDSLLC